MTPTEIVRGILRGDPEAEEALYSLMADRVARFITTQTGPQNRDDILHDAFLVTLDAIRHGKVKEPEHLLLFARRIARWGISRVVRDRIEARERYVSLATATRRMPDAAASSLEIVSREQLLDLVTHVMSNMHQHDREVLMREFIDGDSLEQIRKDLGLKGSVLSHLRARSIKILRDRVKDILRSPRLLRIGIAALLLAGYSAMLPPPVCGMRPCKEIAISSSVGW